ncbi:hypothetical protein BGZ99_003808 [Dissophora globulifera]|uniref:BTB domain-containing protein n=1 Tax=Dissophora globulifera TaxID=979702 RepID=A0A9P6RNT0_9FUNG|nr:hypothetical protein BGZ99_003808 [Dissophora globulifera]
MTMSAPTAATSLFGSVSTATPSTATATGSIGSAATITSTPTPITTAAAPTTGTTTIAAGTDARTSLFVSQTAEYSKAIRFWFDWPSLEMYPSKTYSKTVRPKSTKPGDDIQFQCTVKQVEDCFVLNLVMAKDEDFQKMLWVKSATILSTDGSVRRTCSTNAWPSSRMINVSGPLEAGLLPKTILSKYVVQVILSNESIFPESPVLADDLPHSTHCDGILIRMLEDVNSYDVFFDFEVPETFDTALAADVGESLDISMAEAGGGSRDNLGVKRYEVKDKKEDYVVAVEDGNKERVIAENKNATTDRESNKNNTNNNYTTGEAKVKDENQGQDKGKGRSVNDESAASTNNNMQNQNFGVNEGSSTPATVATAAAITTATIPTTRTESVGAHKLVLAGSNYFKTMFSSSFAEGGPGVKRVIIKDTDIHCFRLLIEFLYLGRLRASTYPKILTEDQAVDELPTWEDVYLVADRYDVPALRQMAVVRLLAGLDGSWAVSFLFRTAYLFEDLRPRLIRYVAQHCMAKIVDKKLQKQYFDHPECSSIFGEIMSELWSSVSRQARSTTAN